MPCLALFLLSMFLTMDNTRWYCNFNKITYFRSPGFDSARLRQVIIRDVRKLNTPEKTLELDCSTGVLMALWDPDTCMLFLAGKGDTTIAYMEVADREPYLIEGIRHSGYFWYLLIYCQRSNSLLLVTHVLFLLSGKSCHSIPHVNLIMHSFLLISLVIRSLMYTILFFSSH